MSYARWRASDPVDIGNATKRALDAITQDRTGQPAAAARAAADPRSASNGALMRQSPLAIWGALLPPDLLADVVRRDTSLTHPHVECGDASEVFVLTVATVIRSGLSGEEAWRFAVDYHRAHGRNDVIAQALHRAADSMPHFGPDRRGHVAVALQNAFYQALHARSFEAGLVTTAMQGEDADTNAAVAGVLLGAVYGADSIPQRWRTSVEECRPDDGQPGVVRSRPQIYWPGDVRSKVRELAWAGQAFCDGLKA